MLEQHDGARKGSVGPMVDHATQLQQRVHHVLGPEWTVKPTATGLFYVTNGATRAPYFAFLQRGFGENFTDSPKSLHEAAGGTAKAANTHVVIRIMDSTSVPDLVAAAEESVRAEAGGRPVLTIGYSAGGAVTRAFAATHPELVTCSMDLNSVGNAIQWGSAFWRTVGEIGNALVDAGTSRGDTVTARLDDGLRRLMSSSDWIPDEMLRDYLDGPMRVVNEAVHAAELTASALMSPNMGTDLYLAGVRLVREHSEDWMSATCMRRFCAQLEVRPQMASIGRMHRSGKRAPVVMPVRGARDMACTATMMKEASALMASPLSVTLPRVSHLVGCDHPAVASLVRVAKEFTHELAGGAKPEVLASRVGELVRSTPKAYRMTIPDRTASRSDLGGPTDLGLAASG